MKSGGTETANILKTVVTEAVDAAKKANDAAETANKAAKNANDAAAGASLFSRIFLKIPGEQRGGIFSRPTLGIFGEAGPEALIPLGGKNKKFGAKLLEYIIPRYYPNLLRYAQEGGIFGATYNKTITYTTGPSTTEQYNITGPITVTGVANVQDFMNELRTRARVAGGR